MRAYRDAPIGRKLNLIVLMPVGVCLLLTGALLTWHDYRSIEEEFVAKMREVAELLGSQSSAALNFERRDGAQKVLNSLHLEPAVLFASIYDAAGNVFVVYRTEAADDVPPPPQETGHAFAANGDLQIFRQLDYDNSKVGAIYLRCTLDYAYRPVRNRLIAHSVILVVALGLALLLTWPLQRSVTGPIRRLVEATRRISERGDYALRVPKDGNDELGKLCDEYNAMLQQIEKREAELLRHRGQLETLVQERTNSLEAKTQELARSNAELELFASVASHDLQEPLRMISSYVELLAQRYHDQLDERAGRWINFAVEGAARMKQLINDLLEFSRVGTRGKPFEPTDCNVLLQQVTTNLQRAIADSGAEVSSGPLPTVVADPVQLAQLLQNLINNGIKFRGQEPPRIRVEAQRNGTAWQFSVRDNGIGIDPQFAQRIFIIFQRLHTREEYPGTGIGLAVCKKIVERLGGNIWVDSQPGQGATFTFTIPDRKET